MEGATAPPAALRGSGGAVHSSLVSHEDTSRRSGRLSSAGGVDEAAPSRLRADKHKRRLIMRNTSGRLTATGNMLECVLTHTRQGAPDAGDLVSQLVKIEMLIRLQHGTPIRRFPLEMFK